MLILLVEVLMVGALLVVRVRVVMLLGVYVVLVLVMVLGVRAWLPLLRREGLAVCVYMVLRLEACVALVVCVELLLCERHRR
jgi:hypothetical protein